MASPGQSASVDASGLTWLDPGCLRKLLPTAAAMGEKLPVTIWYTLHNTAPIHDQTEKTMTIVPKAKE